MRNTIQAMVIVVTPLILAGSATAQTGSPILAPVEERVLSSNIVTLGTARYGLPKSISITPSALKAKAGVITTLPSRNTQLREGDVMLTASGRPVFVLQGKIPAYRDLVPGTSGDDVRQLEQALKRLGFDPGPIDGTYDEQTSTAVIQWYNSAEWEPFGATFAQLANIRTLEESSADAAKTKLAAVAAATAAALAVESAKAAAEHANNAAAAGIEAQTAARDKAKADLANATLVVEAARATADRLLKAATTDRAAKMADRKRLIPTSGSGTPLAVEAARATAELANKAARADIQAKIAGRALIVMDPRQTSTARAAADAHLELARAAALKIQLEGKVAVQAAERAAELAAEQFELTEAAVKAAQLEGEVAIQAALNAQKVAERNVKLAEGQLELARAAARVKQLEGEAAFQAAVDAQRIAKLDAKLTADRAARLAADLDMAKRKVGVQVPADEIVFIPALPVRVEQANVLVGDAASGAVMAVTDNQLAIDSSLPLDTAPLVKPGMQVAIDEQALGIKARGVVARVADTPGTHGVDRQHIYFKVRVDETPTTLEGVSLRLTIPVESTKGAVTAVPISAVSRAADGTSRIQVKHDGALEYIVVEPGLSDDGFVQVTPVEGTLAAGQLVVVGYENPEKMDLQ